MASTPNLDVTFPEVEKGRLDQHEEWCEVRQGDKVERIRFHDYARIYEIPGLYEELFYRRLQCTSPTTVGGLLASELEKAKEPPSGRRVLDVGAGNGMVGEVLREKGIPTVVGIDLVDQAKAACERDRPGIYADYLVANLITLSQAERERLQGHKLNTFTTVAALGFGDIPDRAFAAAWNLVETPAWVAFNIKEAFLSEKYRHGFSLLIRRLIDTGLLESKIQHRYLHRKSVAGDDLFYLAIVGRKTGPIPESWLAELGEG